AEGGNDMIISLRPYLFHPQWEEVVVHVAALLAPPRATTLLRAILDDPDPTGRFLRRGPLLALRCLVDGSTVADRAVLDQIFADGDAIGKTRWLAIPIEFTKLINQLLAGRYESESRAMRNQIEQAARKELPDDDYTAFYISCHDSPVGPKSDAVG